MLPTESGRGQTEPLAALVSVAAVCVAVSVYAGFASSLVPELGGDQRVDRATLDSVWADASEDGVVDAGGVANRIETETLPRGHRVAVTVTTVGADGRLDAVDSVTFDASGSRATLDPPETAPSSSRPVPVRVADGDVRPGTLTVVVWDV
jgi:hypothetical protein